MSSWELTPSNTFRVANEYDRLTHVVLGTPHGYDQQIDNNKNTQIGTEPDSEQFGGKIEHKLEHELAGFRSTLEEYGIQVYHPVWIEKCPHHQIAIRDIGFIIGDTLVIANFRNQNRSTEFEGIRHLISQWEGRVTLIPDSVYLQGSDVLLDGRKIFVASGGKTSSEAIDFIKKNFYEHYNVIPVPCKSVLDGENIPHLDYAFNILGHQYALIYPQGLESVPQVIRDEYQWIEITKEEADMLAANVLSINPDTIICNSDQACRRINDQLKKIGFHVIELNFSHLTAAGYSFRSATLPLHRKSE